METVIIHLSDIHLSTLKNALLDKKQKLFDAILSNVINAKAAFILISGDIANTGNSEEYNIANGLFKELKNYK